MLIYVCVYTYVILSATANSLPPPGLGSSEETLGSTPGSTLGSPAQNLPQIRAACQKANCAIICLPQGSGQPARIWGRFWAACPGCCPGLLPGFGDLLPPVKNPLCRLSVDSINYNVHIYYFKVFIQKLL